MDISYKNYGLFTQFYPESKSGEQAYNELASQNEGVANILTIHSKDVIKQLRQAGYKVGKTKPCNMSIDDILKELDNLGGLEHANNRTNIKPSNK